ncbi:MAG: inosamine-phosphate amidinotransferase 1 [bacterium]
MTRNPTDFGLPAVSQTLPCPVNAHNEWDPIEEIIVGDPSFGRWPAGDLGFERAARGDAFPTGPLPERVIEETREDIEAFVEVLTGLGIRVRRARPQPPHALAFAGWQTERFFTYCPRDVLLTIGDTVIESPNAFRSRACEAHAYTELLVEYLRGGARWIAAPRPRLDAATYAGDAETGSMLAETEPVFDAANVVRAGRDLFYQVSDSGNLLGARWLQSTLGDGYRVHACRGLYRGFHLDTTLVMLRPGLVLINPERVSDDNLPPLLRSWDRIVAPPMVHVAYSDLKPLGSAWIGMNVLMLRPDLAVVDRNQTPLIRLLEKHGIEVVPGLLRHGRTLGGGFHCITADVRRRGALESYFD